jgi:ketosteroid isomerase-like protein
VLSYGPPACANPASRTLAPRFRGVELRRQSSGHYPDVIDKASRRAERRTARRDTARAMSQQNMEILRVSIEDFLDVSSESDREGVLSRGAETWDPDIELDCSDAPVLDINRVYRGTAAVKQFWREWIAAWETIRISSYRLVDAGDRVVQLFELRMRGRSTGIELPGGKLAWVYTFRDRLVVHQKFYMSQSEALEAVGLSEQDAHADS